MGVGLRGGVGVGAVRVGVGVDVCVCVHVYAWGLQPGRWCLNKKRHLRRATCAE